LPGSSVDGWTASQILAYAYQLYSQNQPLPADVANAVGYMSGGALGDGGSGEGQPPGSCRLQSPCVTPTNTVVPPTRTPTNTNTPAPPTPTRTNTPPNPAVAPTRTPTNTPVPPTRTPTRTPAPPTVTPSCVPETPVVVVTPAFTPGPGCSSVPPSGVLTAAI